MNYDEAVQLAERVLIENPKPGRGGIVTVSRSLLQALVSPPKQRPFSDKYVQGMASQIQNLKDQAAADQARIRYLEEQVRKKGARS